MKNKKSLFVALPLVALILEILPYGAVLNFANPEGEPWRRTYSYFSMMPFGYANIGPLITAILTCVLLVLAVIYLFKPCKGLNIAIVNIAGLATVASLMPLMLGLDYTTWLGFTVTVLLAGTFGCGFIKVP